MGKESVDIDIALDDLSGQDFADLVDKKINPGSKKRGYGVIGMCSDKAKHLETATMPVHGMSLDMVNLRSETYTDETRVPVIEIGTPEQDAFRRDLTINAMFYNINMGKVEDYTKLGVSDLRDGIIRTPLLPLETYLDDPLRVLRTVRFATRFDFKMVPDIHNAATNPEVVRTLETKVSVERVMKELDLMLSGKLPAQALKYLYDFGIIKSILKIPERCEVL